MVTAGCNSVAILDALLMWTGKVAGPDHLALLLAVVIIMFMTSLYGSERKTNEPVRFSPVLVWDITICAEYKTIHAYDIKSTVC